MTKQRDLWLYNTLTRKKERFEPLNAANVRLYVCGPTVYDYAHIGNARPIIVFDVLFRLLRHLYGAEHVTYVRNITDVDDKINARAAQEGVSIEDVTRRTTEQFHKDIAALGVLEPTVEPRATDHIKDMKAMIERLIERGHAYVAENHVLFDVSSMADYGQLSKRPLDEMIAGARVEVAAYKKNPTDFVLWKPSKAGEPSWESPAGIEVKGRPGWHIECSAMAAKHLGTVFDIHGGGIDLTFPHHENEVAQSRCAYGTDTMANVWMHNGFVQVEGEKMSKSLGNFITINDLLETDKFGASRWHGSVLKMAMLMTHYTQPIDWTVERLTEVRKSLCSLIRIAEQYQGKPDETQLDQKVLDALLDDLNTPMAVARLHELAKLKTGNESKMAAASLNNALRFFGVWNGEPADAIETFGFIVDTDQEASIEQQVKLRTMAIQDKNWAEADRIRDALLAEGIQLKDGKNPDTGERETSWEIKR